MVEKTFIKKMTVCFFIMFCYVTAYASVSVKMYMYDEALSQTNRSNPRIYLQNTGTESISNITYYYYFMVEGSQQPILEDYYTPDENISLQNVTGSIYRIVYTIPRSISPGEIVPNTGGNVITLHYNNWAGVWDKTNDFSNIQSATFQEDLNIAVYYNGVRIYGNEPVTSVPSDPTALNAAVLSSEQINLTWTDNSNNETGFKIERSNDGVAYTEIQTVSSGVTSFQNSGLTQGTLYYYRVRAYNSLGNSGYSNVVSATTLPSLPTTPSTLVATVISSQQIDLTWTDNSSNETGFRIERSNDGVSYTEIQTVSAGVTSFQNTGLTPNTQYFYRVRAYNAAGNSTYSNIVNATTLVSLPAAPTALNATVISSQQINLTWVDNSTNEDGFKIERSIDGTTYSEIQDVASGSTTFQNIGLDPATQYYYRIRAYNGAGYSAYSNVVNATTQPSAINAPGALSAAVVSSQQINLSWADNSTNETGFKIERSDDGVTFTEIQTVAADLTSYQNVGLSPNTQYYYRVRAYNAGSYSAFSNIINATTLNSSINPPGSLTATAVSAQQINLTWSDNSSNELGFRIERSADGVIFNEISLVGANITAYQNYGLLDNTLYYYRIKAYNASETSSYSNIVNVTTPQSIPNAPSALIVSSINVDEINISWSDNSNNETGFKIERSSDGVTFTEIGSVTANLKTYQNSGLVENTRYYYRVRAYNGSGNSAYSNIVDAVTTQTPPVAPGTLSATAVSPLQIDLSWNDNSDNEDGFKIERSGNGISFFEFQTVVAGATSYQNIGLSPNTEYFYRIRAYNNGGSSSYSNVVRVTTAQSLPNDPSDLQAIPVSTQQINLSWKDNSNIETGYSIERSIDGATFTVVQTVGEDVTTFQNSGLSSGTQFYYRVRAYNSAGSSSYSNTVNVSTEQTLPNAPSGLSVTPVSSQQIDLAWTDNSSNENGFSIERSKDGVSFVEIQTVLTDVTSFQNTGLTPNTQYYYRVRAFNNVGNSVYTNVVNTTTSQSIPDAPGELTVVSTSPQEIDLVWSDNSSTETGFKIERSLNGTTFNEIQTVGTGVTSFQNTGLTANTQYYYRVRAYNSLGNSSYSNIVNALTVYQASSSLLIQPSLLSYAIFASEQCQMRDRSVFNGNSKIGTNGYVEIGAGAIVNGSVVSGGDVYIRSQATVNGDVTAAGNISLQAAAIIHPSSTDGVKDHAAVTTINLPILADVTVGTEDKTVAPGTTLDLAPSMYKNLLVQSGGTVKLTPGTYTFSNIMVEVGASIVYDMSIYDEIEIFVKNDFDLSDNSRMEFNGAITYPLAAKIYTNDANTVRIGTHVDVAGIILAPRAEIILSDDVELDGGIYAKKVTVEAVAGLATDLVDPDGDADHDYVPNYSEIKLHTNPRDPLDYKAIAIPSHAMIDNSKAVTVYHNYSKFFSGYSQAQSVSIDYPAGSLTDPFSPILFQIRNMPQTAPEYNNAGYLPVGRYIEPLYNSIVSSKTVRIGIPLPDDILPGEQFKVAIYRGSSWTELDGEIAEQAVYADVQNPIGPMILVREQQNAVAYFDNSVYSNGEASILKIDVNLHGSTATSTPPGTITINYKDYTVDPSGTDESEPVDLERIDNETVAVSKVFTFYGRIVINSVNITVNSPDNVNYTATLQYDLDEGQSLTISTDKSIADIKGPANIPDKLVFTYDGNNMVFEYTSVDGEGQIRKGPGGSDYYHFHLKDHLGSTRMVIDDAGNITEATMYQPYGTMNVLASFPSAATLDRQKFTGKEFDTEGDGDGMELFYFGKRYFDAGIGLWLAVDPVHGNDWNAYIYCHQNPLFYTDPDGQDPNQKIFNTARDAALDAKNYLLKMEGYNKYWEYSTAISYDVEEGKYYYVDWETDYSPYSVTPVQAPSRKVYNKETGKYEWTIIPEAEMHSHPLVQLWENILSFGLQNVANKFFSRADKKGANSRGLTSYMYDANSNSLKKYDPKTKKVEKIK
jgi:titin